MENEQTRSCCSNKKNTRKNVTIICFVSKKELPSFMRNSINYLFLLNLFQLVTQPPGIDRNFYNNSRNRRMERRLAARPCTRSIWGNFTLVWLGQYFK